MKPLPFYETGPALAELCHVIRVASGAEEADLVLKNLRYLNVFTGELLTSDIALAGGRIAGLGRFRGKTEMDGSGMLALPGLIDAHIHLESALLSPRELIKALLPCGSTTLICDPHEIANIAGTAGIDYMLRETEGLPLDVRFMLPSCVPATAFDEAGAALDPQALAPYYAHPRVMGLGEMMNYPGVLATDRDPLEKVLAARLKGKPVDGHAPGLQGKALGAYVAAGIRSDHECAALEEALEKLRLGQMIIIREGTAAHNLQALVSLLSPPYEGRCMLCTDDNHPGDLLRLGHMDGIIRRAVSLGADPVSAVKAATINPARHYRLEDKGAIAPGYRADLILVDDLEAFNVKKVFQNGRLVAENGLLREPLPDGPEDQALSEKIRDSFHMGPFEEASLRNTLPLPLIGMIKGQILTTNLGYAENIQVERDILKIASIERHKNTGHTGLGFVKGYGLRSGAVATSVSHDSHNVVVIGAREKDMAAAVRLLACMKGGIAVVENGLPLAQIPLPIAGIMSDKPLKTVDLQLQAAKKAAYSLGVHPEIDPFMTLSFMALPVIPSLRITTRGIFDVDAQKFL